MTNSFKILFWSYCFKLDSHIVYSPLNSYVYIHWILDFKYILLLLTEQDQVNQVSIYTLQELCKMRDGILYSGLTTHEIQVLIDFICTMDIMPIP